jgi:hypothetical protein
MPWGAFIAGYRGQIDPSVTDAAESLFKDTVLSAPELVQVLRDPQVRQSLPLNILNKSDDLFNKFADAPPEAFKYAMNTRDYDDPDFAERVIPVIDAKKYTLERSMDPLYQRAMRETSYASRVGGLPVTSPRVDLLNATCTITRNTCKETECQ